MLSRSVWRPVPAALVLAASAAALTVPSSASAAPAQGKLKVVVAGAKKVPANVAVRAGKVRLIVARPADAKGQFSSVLTLPTGGVSLKTKAIAAEGKVYAATVKPARPVVRKGKTTAVRVEWKAVSAASKLRITSVQATAITLDWSAPKGVEVALRRAVGTDAPRSATKGDKVVTTGQTANDTKLAAGTRYTYALFSRQRGKAWAPALILATQTASGDPAAARYAAPPTTVIVEPGDTDTVVPGAGTVQVTLRKGRPTPLLGAGFVLPVSAALPSGFLGKVSAISPDGRTVTLVGAGLSDAFDYYDIDVNLATLDPIPLTPSASGARASGGLAQRSGIPAGLKKCLGGSAEGSVKLNPVIKPGGHFKSSFVKKWGIPIAADVDLSAQLEVGFAADIDVSAQLSCGLGFDKIVRNITVTPVPIAIAFEPVAEVTIGGSMSVQNLGYTVTGGFWTKGRLGIGGHMDGGLIGKAGPTQTTGSYDVPVSLALGGELTVGPGGGSAAAGAVAGVGGKFYPLKASFGAHFPAGDVRHSACVRTTAGYEGELNVNAKAWIGDWKISASFSPPGLHYNGDYGGPWFIPGDCEKAPEPDPAKPSTSILGNGVAEVGSTTTGDGDQWGHVDGFAPGSKAWVLSTGKIADASVDDPSIGSSTALGGAGDAGLSSLIDGLATHDAASYSITVKPTGKTLHVRYVFASEEYPEYVGKGYDDVMAVYVNGQNCALVPGTSERVSVDSINDHTNAQYYVDNSTDSAGYSTTMDGITVPLECAVPVTPGQPVTVRIAIADAGDEVLDSVVGLVDKGIWST